MIVADEKGKLLASSSCPFFEVERQDRKPHSRWATKANPAKAGDAKLRG
jgi:hypothetical protein